MKEVDFSNIDKYVYTQIRDNMELAFDEIKELYGLDIMVSIFEDIKSYVEDENEIEI